MNQYVNLCSECGKSLRGKSAQAKTCGPTCRKKRSKRLKNVGGQVLPEGQREMQAVLRREAPDIAHKVIADELRPVIREAMTEDVLRSIHSLVGLTPMAIAAIEEDMQSPNTMIRQRAYKLVLQYTAGHPALVRPDDVSNEKQLIVNFNLPRPGSGVSDGMYEGLPSPEPDEAVELKTCDVCGTEKPASDFIDGSDRCSTCWESMRSEVLERFGS